MLELGWCNNFLEIEYDSSTKECFCLCSPKHGILDHPFSLQWMAYQATISSWHNILHCHIVLATNTAEKETMMFPQTKKIGASSVQIRNIPEGYKQLVLAAPKVCKGGHVEPSSHCALNSRMSGKHCLMCGNSKGKLYQSMGRCKRNVATLRRRFVP